MRQGARRARPALRAALGALLAAACLSSSTSYDPARDDQVVAVATGDYAAGGAGALTLALCEDLAREAEWTGPDCDFEHVVKGGGRGLPHRESHSGTQCGGCPFQAAVLVQGQAAGGPFSAPVQVEGMVWLQDPREKHPYDFPYHVNLWCVDRQAPCAIEGTIDATGHLELGASLGTPGAATRHALDRVGAPTCP
jgi:hypothetical protein